MSVSAYTPTPTQYLAGNADKQGTELTFEGKAILLALRELAAGGASGAGIVTTQGASTSTTATTNAQGTKAVTTAGTPVLLVATQTLVESVLIQAQKGVATSNVGNIYVGFSASGGSNLLVLTPGESLAWEATAGKKIDLHTIYIDAVTSADAVAYTSIN